VLQYRRLRRLHEILCREDGIRKYISLLGVVLLHGGERRGNMRRRLTRLGENGERNFFPLNRLMLVLLRIGRCRLDMGGGGARIKGLRR